MSQENVEIVRRAMAAAIAKPPDVETINALYHPDHVLTTDWGVEGTGYCGARGFAEAVADMDALWSEWRQEVDEVFDAGDSRVVVAVRLLARGRESGALVENATTWVINLRDGKISATRAYLDRDEALKAVGLEE